MSRPTADAAPRRAGWIPCVFALLWVLGGCGAPGEAEIAAAEADLRLVLDLPTRLPPGDTGALTLRVENHSDGRTGGFDLHVVIPAWLEVIDPEVADTVVAGPAGVRLGHRIAEGALTSGETFEAQYAVRRVEVPPDRTAQLGSVIRAWLSAADGAAIGDPAEGRVPGAPTPAGATVGGEGVGPARLGAQIALLRENVQGTRDTLVRMGQREYEGLVVPVDDQAVAYAAAANGVVVAVIVRSSRLRTEAGAGVGTSLRRLDRLYGHGCVVREGDAVLALFPVVPAIQFRISRGGAPLEPGVLQEGDAPRDALVEEVWIRRPQESC